jgi:hypothetical protein
MTRRNQRPGRDRDKSNRYGNSRGQMTTVETRLLDLRSPDQILASVECEACCGQVLCPRPK